MRAKIAANALRDPAPRIGLPIPPAGPPGRDSATPAKKVRRPFRWGRLPAALALLIATGCSRPRPPQAILITIDTLRADHVTPDLTPALQSLGRDSVTFSDAVANATTTLPSLASMLTGRLPWRQEVLANEGELDPSMLGLAGLLKSRGFATGAVVSSFPLRTGVSGLERGFDLYDQSFDSNEINRRGQLVKTPEETTRVAVEWAREHRAQAFFLWVHYFPPHGPYVAPPEYLDPAEASSGETLPVSKVNYEPGAIPAYQQLDIAPDAGLYRSRYSARVRYVDALVGRLLRELREMGVYQNATIVVTADHGESLGEHGHYFCHGDLVYDEQARIPLLLKLRDGARSGSRMSEPVEAVDIMPTLLQALEVAIPKGLDGRSLLAPLPSSRTRLTASTSAEVVAVREASYELTLRIGPPRLLPENHPPLELFFLDSDPQERHDRSAEKPALARRLEGEILDRIKTARPVKALDPEVADRLKTLGYIR